jgi:nucleoid-associated protein YgaU
MRLAPLALVAALSLAGCDQQDRMKEAIELGDRRAKLGAYTEAIRAYESALDGTAKTAEVHYKIAFIYDDKLKRPMGAIHHYDRYLELAPEGSRVKEAKVARTECEKQLHLEQKPGGFMTTAEGVRLRNENEDLRKLIAELRNPKPTPSPRQPNPGVPDKIPPGARMHVVEKGETLASIAFKYYRNRAQSGRIKDANVNQLGGKDIIRPGQTLIIPELPGRKKP